MVQHFLRNAPSKRTLALGINKGPNTKWKKKKPEDLENSSDTAVEITSKSQAVATLPVKEGSSSEESSNSEEEKLEADVEEDELVAGYLQKVTPEIAREFQV